jgi:hypothetical protein
VIRDTGRPGCRAMLTGPSGIICRVLAAEEGLRADANNDVGVR